MVQARGQFGRAGLTLVGYSLAAPSALAVASTGPPNKFPTRGTAVKSGTGKPVRCAIYTRVSTDHGLEQDFNSLDAQHDAAQAYIRSQAHAGWTLIRARYDDGGYSRGPTAPPPPPPPFSHAKTRQHQ